MVIDDFLVNPDTDEKLLVKWRERTISNISQDKYYVAVENEIPVILPKSLNDNLNKTDLHNQLNTSFEYVEHYVKDANSFDYFEEPLNNATKEEKRRLNQMLISEISQSDSVILDVGCGGGWLNKKLKNSNIISLDISLTNVRKVLKNHPLHMGVVADVFHLPIREDSIDYIVASEIIEHVSDPHKFILNLLKPLKKGGKLIISTPYKEVITYHLCVHCNNLTPTNSHLHSFDESKIESIIPNFVTSYNIKKIGNKIMVKLRFYLLIKWLPFKMWCWIDKQINKLIKKQERLIVVITK
jgi:2-polyprenyl-3-methyl-5-hydroxy-6-metoxy-1,4-benzoquinol methylase